MGGYGRYISGPDHYLDEVELVSIDPVLHPVPDCLTQLNPLPEPHGGAAGALDYSGKGAFKYDVRTRGAGLEPERGRESYLGSY